MDYRREIDGLRALAVLPVILFHAGFETFSGGYIGVDVFFVISGYLITTIILTELGQDKFSIVNFYERRARRILPALFLVIIACIPFAWFLLLPNDMKDFSKSLIAVSTFTSNILFWRESGYFGAAAELKPLLHTWSLAVEEQYYLLFPLFLMFFWKLGKRWVVLTLCFVFVASLAMAQWAAYATPAAAFYLLPTRGWELLIGAFTSLYLSQSNRKDFCKGLSELGGWLGLALIFYAVFSYSKATPFPGFYALIPALGAALIILFATKQNTIGRFVGNKAFTGIGLVSYSAYLWHQPLFSFARYSNADSKNYILFSLLSIFSFILGYLTWRYIEAPFRNKYIFTRRFVFTAALLISINFVALGAFGVFTHGFESRFPKLKAISNEFSWPSSNNITDECKLKFGGDQYCQIADPNSEPTAILIGDSHANHFFPGLSKRLKLGGANLLMFGAGGCPPLIDIDTGFNPGHGGKLNCEFRTSEMYKKLISMDSVNQVFLAFNSEGMFDEKIDYYDSKREIEFNVNRPTAVTLALLRTIKFTAANGKHVFIIEDLPDVTFDAFSKCLAKTDNLDESLPCLKLKNQNQKYFSLLAEMRLIGVEVLTTHQALKNFPYTDTGKFLYRDHTHLSSHGSAFVADSLKLNSK